jgi:hypothetical protein
MLIFCRIHVVLIALVGSIFGQLFFGRFDLWSSVAAISGISAALIGIGSKSTTSRKSLVVLVCSMLALLGELMGAVDYYLHYNIPGNDYAWELRGPYLLALLYMGYSAFKQLRMKEKCNDTSNTDFNPDAE